MMLRLLAAGAMLALLAAPASAGTTLDRVKTAGTVSCGVLAEPEDYGKNDVHGALEALDLDICRAVAAAVLGDAGKITPAGLTDERHGFGALRAGKVDVLLGASPDLSSGIAFGVRFASPVFLDGQGLLAHRGSGIGSVDDLGGKHVCFIAGTEAETVLDGVLERRAPGMVRFPFEENGEMLAALMVGHCDAVLDSVSRLANDRARLRGAPSYAILPDRLSVEPMAPAVLEGDPQWAAVVEATVDALVLAEAGGITRADAAALRTTEDPQLRRLGGTVPGVDGKMVDENWAVRAVGAVGNYSELYERDCGAESKLGLPRGVNALWNRGGLMVPRALR